MENIENLELNQAYDAPDARDYSHEEVFGVAGSNNNLPEDCVLEEFENLVQKGSSCTVVALLNVANETHAQAIPGYLGEKNWQPIWEKAKARGASEAKGWSLQWSLQLNKDIGTIGGYVRVAGPGNISVDTIKRLIAIEKKAIYSGVAIANWRETVRTNEYTLKNASLLGHAFDIIGYNDNYIFTDGRRGAILVGNSFGKNSYFWLAYEDFSHLFSCYVTLNNAEVQKLMDAKKKRKNAYLQKAFELKIWNEERSEEIASESEIRIMLNRALAVTDNKISSDWRTFRSSYAHLFEEKISRGKFKIYNEESCSSPNAKNLKNFEQNSIALNGNAEIKGAKLYNGKQKFHIATDKEIALMFTRAVLRDGSIEELKLTREQVAEVIGRDFL